MTSSYKRRIHCAEFPTLKFTKSYARNILNMKFLHLNNVLVVLTLCSSARAAPVVDADADLREMIKTLQVNVRSSSELVAKF